MHTSKDNNGKKSVENEQRWATTLASIGDAVVATDTSGMITFMNGVAEKLTGWKLNEASQKHVKTVFKIVNEETRLPVENPILKVLKEGMVVGLANHTILIRKDGSEVPIDDSGAPIKDKDSKIVGVVLVFRDITERKKSQEALKASEERYRHLFQYAPTAIYEIDFTGPRFTSVNDAMCVMTGYSRKELLEANPFDLLDTESIQRFRQRIGKALAGEKIDENVEYIGMRKDGTQLCVTLNMKFMSKDGRFYGAQVVAYDITDRKKVEQELWRAKSDWERTFDSVPDFIAILDNQFQIVRANRAMAQQLGLTPEKATGLSCYQCVHRLDNPPNFCPHAQTLKDGKEHTTEVHEPRLGGDFLVSTTPLRDEKGLMIGSVHIARDITERRKTEEALRENEKRLKRSQEIAHLGSWELDLIQNQLTWSDEVYRIFGLKPQEFGATYGAFLDAVHPEDRKKVDEAYSGSLREGRDSYEVEHRIIRKATGEVRFVQEKCEHTRDSSGKIIRSIGMVQDITEQRKVAHELREIRDYLENLLNYASAPIIVWDPQFKITLFNHAFEHMTGLTANDALGKHLNILFPTSKKQEAISHIRRALEGEFWESVEIPILNVDGTVKTALWNSANIYDSAGQAIIATIAQGHDITLRKELQEKLEEKAIEVEEYANQMEQLANDRAEKLKGAERLAAIGATAGMVGHDIRNPLQAITGDLYLAKAELASTPESDEKKNVLESLTEIEKNVDYINKIVADLQDFARPLSPHAEESDLKLIIDELLSKNSLPKNVKVRVKVDTGTKKIMADSSYINRILYNLITNAVQAMPKGGQLTINACRDNKAKAAILTVEDTGVGIPENVKNKLFTPMFTTKSKGQGFGLAVVKRMTEALGGSVSFESQEGKGTRFILRLPCSAESLQ